MHQFAGTTFGIGTPITSPIPQQSFQPVSAQPIGVYGIGAAQLSPQILPLLQAVTQQLQYVQVLQQQQLFHLQQLQQLLQLIPAQLQQLQQLTQFVPQQVQQFEQPWQQFGQGMPSQFGIGMTPSVLAGQPAQHVM
jgi:hypothetical protein